LTAGGCFLFFFLPPLLSFFLLKFVGGLGGLCGNHGSRGLEPPAPPLAPPLFLTMTSVILISCAAIDDSTYALSVFRSHDGE
jgi:hypothetical protein